MSPILAAALGLLAGVIADSEGDDIGLAEISESGTQFETGRPATFPFLRNTEKSPFLGSRFQQDIEPAGKYVLHDTDPTSKLVRGWERGQMTLRCPLVLKFNTRGELRYDETSWKARLSRRFGAVGAELSRRLRATGIDGVVTVHDDETKEIVILP